MDSDYHDLDWYMEAKGRIIDVNKNCDIFPCSDTRSVVIVDVFSVFSTIFIMNNLFDFVDKTLQ